MYFKIILWLAPVGRDSAVGIAARYGLEGPGKESRWGRDQTGPKAHPAAYTMGTKLLSRG
jgi:hypothetical protein